MLFVLLKLILCSPTGYWSSGISCHNFGRCLEFESPFPLIKREGSTLLRQLFQTSNFRVKFNITTTTFVLNYQVIFVLLRLKFYWDFVQIAGGVDIFLFFCFFEVYCLYS